MNVLDAIDLVRKESLNRAIGVVPIDQRLTRVIGVAGGLAEQLDRERIEVGA
jgi:hypothetical protein